jgi:capsular exopolysaccharide synthesis family protein
LIVEEQTMMPEPKPDFSQLNPVTNPHSNGAKPRDQIISPQFMPLSLMTETGKQKAVTGEEESIDFRQILNILKRRWGIISSITIGLSATVAIWTYQQPSIYEGKFSMLVEGNSDPTNSSNQNHLASFWGMPTIDYETEIEILSSPSILNPIIQEIAQTYPEIQEQVNLDPLENLEIKQLKETKILEISFRNEEPEKIKFVLAKIADAYLAKNLEERKTDIKEGLKFVQNQLPRLQQRVDTLQTELQSFRQQYNLVDPEIQSNGLTQQLIEIEQNYFEAQVQLQQANSAYQILQQQLNLSPEQAIAVSYLTESPHYQNLLQQLQDAEIELANQSAIYTEQSPQIQTLTEKRDNILKLLRQETNSLIAQQFGSISDQKRISLSAPSQIRSQLTEEFVLKANEIQVLQTRTNSLQTVLKDLNQRIKQMPVIARKYTDLQRELKVATQSLTRFLEAKEKLQLEEAQQTLNWKIIAPPTVKQEPIYPVPLKNIVLGFMGGLVLGIVAAFLADELDGSVHSVEEIKDSFPSPILGQIPWQKKMSSVEGVIREAFPQFSLGLAQESRSNWLNRRKSKEYTSSYWIESFRHLYTNVRLLGSDNPVNSLVISSANPGEGKSTVSLNLAQAAAAMGQRVLLIDADLRAPRLHKLLNLDNSRGLSNILATSLDLDSSIQSVPQWDNLAILTAGDIPPDPSRLLHSAKMKQIIEELNQPERFDLIIYDTPPVLGFADAKMLTPYTNGLICVVKIDETERQAVKQLIEQLKISNLSMLGIVANGVKANESGSYYYHRYQNYYKSKQEQVI